MELQQPASWYRLYHIVQFKVTKILIRRNSTEIFRFWNRSSFAVLGFPVLFTLDLVTLTSTIWMAHSPCPLAVGLTFIGSPLIRPSLKEAIFIIFISDSYVLFVESISEPLGGWQNTWTKLIRWVIQTEMSNDIFYCFKKFPATSEFNYRRKML